MKKLSLSLLLILSGAHITHAGPPAPEPAEPNEVTQAFHDAIWFGQKDQVAQLVTNPDVSFGTVTMTKDKEDDAEAPLLVFALAAPVGNTEYPRCTPEDYDSASEHYDSRIRDFQELHSLDIQEVIVKEIRKRILDRCAAPVPKN